MNKMVTISSCAKIGLWHLLNDNDSNANSNISATIKKRQFQNRTNKLILIVRNISTLLCKCRYRGESILSLKNQPISSYYLYSVFFHLIHGHRNKCQPEIYSLRKQPFKILIRVSEWFMNTYCCRPRWHRFHFSGSSSRASVQPMPMWCQVLKRPCYRIVWPTLRLPFAMTNPWANEPSVELPLDLLRGSNRRDSMSVALHRPPYF